MISKIIIVMFMIITLNANERPLFGKVSNISENDRLNVRTSSSYKSKKLTSLPLGAIVGIDLCKKKQKSKWCKIYPLTNIYYENFYSQHKEAWVNARYLTFKNNGYVTISDKRNCDYSIGCKNSMCQIVSDYITNHESKIIELETRWVNRNNLQAESSFGATADNIDGYCNNGLFIEDYLRNK